MKVKISQWISKNIDLCFILCLIGICFLFFSPYIFSNPVPLIAPTSDLGTDLTRDVLPNIEYVINSIKTNAELPLWRAYLLSGAPVVGHPSLPIFYPPNWLLLALPLPLGLNLLAVLDFIWMGIGMYGFLRISSSRKPLPALLGGIAMALSPKWIAHLSGGHWFMLAALSWMPWALLALDRYWKTKKVTWLFFLAVALASQGMNHLPIFIITALTLGGFSLAAFSRKHWPDWLKTNILGWGLVILLVSGLMAAQVLPFLELYPISTHTSGNSTFTSLNPAALLVSIFPPDFKYPEWFLFSGVGVLVFASLSWAYGGSHFEKKWAIAGLLGLILSLGEYTPVYSWLFGWNPLLSVLRVPTRWWLLTILALIVLASSGFERWMENGYRLNRRAKIAVSILLGLEFLAGVMRIGMGKNFPFDTLPTGIASVVLGILLVLGQARRYRSLPGWILLGLMVELFVVGGTLIRPLPADETGVSSEMNQAVKSGLQSGERIFSPGDGYPALALVRSDIQAAEGYDALPFQNYLRFIRLATGCPLVQEATGSPEETAACLNPEGIRPAWLELLNIRKLVTRQDADWKITDLPQGVGRVFSVQKVLSTSSEECLATLEKVDPQGVALVEGPGKSGPSGEITMTGSVPGVNSESFTVRVGDSASLLIRSESWAPGWQVAVDGQVQQALKVDCILQGVWLEPGEHRVAFVYRPFGYPSGVWISAGTLLGMAICALLILILKKKRKNNS